MDEGERTVRRALWAQEVSATVRVRWPWLWWVARVVWWAWVAVSVAVVVVAVVVFVVFALDL